MRQNILAVGSPEQYHFYARQGTREWTEILTDRIQEECIELKRSDLCVLDIGMGTGHLLMTLGANKRYRGYRFIGVDIDPSMVAFAVAEIKRMFLSDRISVDLGDVHDLHFGDGSIDLVVGRSVVHHWADPVAAFRQVYRVLAEGGRAIIHEPLRDPDPRALAVFNEKRRKANLPQMSMTEKYTVPELQQQLEAARIECASRITRGDGLAALGCEIYIKKGTLTK